MTVILQIMIGGLQGDKMACVVNTKLFFYGPVLL